MSTPRSRRDLRGDAARVRASFTLLRRPYMLAEAPAARRRAEKESLARNMTKPSSRARVALVGLGPIGLEVGRALATRGGVEFLGAADPATDIAGKKLMDLLPIAGDAGGLAVDASARDLYGRSANS